MTRDKWRKLWDRCMACGKRSAWPGYEIHEIACGPARQAAMKESAAWLFLCSGCHRGDTGMEDYSVWPIARQLCLKRKYDNPNYDREAVNRLRGRAPNAISEEDVDKYADTV